MSLDGENEPSVTYEDLKEKAAEELQKKGIKSSTMLLVSERN